MRKTILLIIVAIFLLVACTWDGVRELRGENAPAEQPQPAWAAGMPPELAAKTYSILESVMLPENVVVVLVCFTQAAESGEQRLVCMGVHPGVFAVAAEEMQ